MKSVFKVLFIALLSVFCMGAYEEYTENQYEKIVLHEVVRSGDTLDGIIEQYYDAKTEKRSWQEFRYAHMNRNSIHYANGRCLQVGDIVCIEIYRKK